MLRCLPVTARAVGVHQQRHRSRQLSSALASLRVSPVSSPVSQARTVIRRSSSSSAETVVDMPPAAPDSKLASLRAAMKAAGVDAFLVPSQDPHFSEYVPTCFERRAFVSGFTGSAGTALVTGEKALLWTDGRYFLQAEQELSSEWTLMRGGQPGVPEPKAWLGDEMPAGSKIGVDADVHSLSEARALRQHLEQRDMSLVYVDTNPVDVAWGAERPPSPPHPSASTPPSTPGVPSPRRSDPSARRCATSAWTDSSSPRSTRWRGCSTCAAATWRITPCRWRTESSERTPRRCTWTPRR